MLFFNDKSKPLGIYFIREEHLALLKSKGIPFQDLPNLLYYDISSDDLVSWISFQRAMEEKLFNRKITKYDNGSALKFADRKPYLDMDILSPKLELAYDETKYYDDVNISSYLILASNIIILLKDNAILDPGFKPGKGSVLKTIFSAILHEIGYYQLYFHNPIRDKDQEGITLPELIAKLTA